jgi:hypothetical protein
MDPHGHIPGFHLPGSLIPRQDHEEALRLKSCLPQHAAVEVALVEPVGYSKIQRLTATTDLCEIAELLEASTDARTRASAATRYEGGWRATVVATWRRLSDAGTFGPPSHDIVTVRCRWPALGKPQHLVFEELARKPGLLVLDAQPFCLREGLDSITETRGRMDVWIAADGKTFRREEVYRPGCGESRAARDARLTYYLSNDTRQGAAVTVAVPVGEPPRTKDVRGTLFRPGETTGLRDTIVLTDRGSRASHSLDHELGTVLAAAIRKLPSR